ncbi:hypothetical protein YC2023_033095 [Brassica napus]
MPPEELENLNILERKESSSPVKKLMYLTGTDSSSHVSESVSVHSGFFNENGGFRISDEDKKFMRGCQIVVSTCAFGGGNNLYQPIGMSKASTQKVCHSDSLELKWFNMGIVNNKVCHIWLEGAMWKRK